MSLTLRRNSPETSAAQPGRPQKTMVCPTAGGLAASEQVKVSGIELHFLSPLHQVVEQ